MTSTNCNQSPSQDEEHHSTSTTPFDDNLQSKIDTPLNNNKETSLIGVSINIPESNSPTPPERPPPRKPPKAWYFNVAIHNTNETQNGLPSDINSQQQSNQSPSQQSVSTDCESLKDQSRVHQEPAPSLFQRHVLTLQACSAEIFQKLHVSAIVPYLMKHNMLTLRDQQVLTNDRTPDQDKIGHILKILPKKGEEFYGKFVFCLCESKEGTGSAHDEIVKVLTAKIHEIN